mmetsp:Transcript_92690/g.200382  ORF Transcript_92690/g.200382 Transcript_92690/m.200382 type:complete len:212 (+) Transcript_92690:77-712(+)
MINCADTAGDDTNVNKVEDVNPSIVISDIDSKMLQKYNKSISNLSIATKSKKTSKNTSKNNSKNNSMNNSIKSLNEFYSNYCSPVINPRILSKSKKCEKSEKRVSNDVSDFKDPEYTDHQPDYSSKENALSNKFTNRETFQAIVNMDIRQNETDDESIVIEGNLLNINQSLMSQSCDTQFKDKDYKDCVQVNKEVKEKEIEIEYDTVDVQE